MNAVGIDFGTTNSVVAKYAGKSTTVVPCDTAPIQWAPYGFDRVFPSVMATDERGRLCFGWEAKRSSSGRFEAVKRMFASQLDVALDDRGDGLAVEEVATMLFAELKKRSSEKGYPFDQAVVTVPANSKGRARHRTKLCAGMAGVEVLALINEPTAAAMAYAQKHPNARQLLVFDWGGGTLDVTILHSVDGVFIEQTSSGLPRVGGIDFDSRLEKLIRESSPNLGQLAPEDRHLLRQEVELAKIRLSGMDATSIELPGGSEVRVTRSRYEAEITPLIEEARLPLQRCLRDLAIGPGSIDALVMVGGTCKIPAVRSFVRDILKVEPDPDIDPMTAVGEGAAIAAAILTGELASSDFFVSLEHSLGTFTFDPSSGTQRFSTLIPRGHKLPAKVSSSFVPVVRSTEAVEVEVVEGDPESATPDFTILKEWIVPLPPAESEESDRSFELQYEYDIDGIVHVTAVDSHTGAVLLEDDVAYGIATNKRDLKRISDRAKGSVASGVLDSASRVEMNDPEAVKLLNQAKVKVIPFLDPEEAKVIQNLVVELETSEGAELDRNKEALRKSLVPYSYLF